MSYYRHRGFNFFPKSWVKKFRLKHSVQKRLTIRRKGIYARNTQIGSHTMETLSCVPKSLMIKLYSSIWRVFSSSRGFLRFPITTYCVLLCTQGHLPLKAKHSHFGAAGDTVTHAYQHSCFVQLLKTLNNFLLLLLLSVALTAIAQGIPAAIKEGLGEVPKMAKQMAACPFLFLQASTTATPHNSDYLVLVCCKQNLQT